MSTDAETRLGLSLDAKVAFLKQPAAYAEGTNSVEAIETHMAWVFLTDDRAYKLKKPVRHAYLDFSTLEARRKDSHEEVLLNQALAPDVYLGTVALTASDDGFAIAGPGETVDWLVVMRKLDRDGMLDCLLAQGTWRPDQIQQVVAALVRFYRRAPRVAITGTAYRDRLRREIEADRAELKAIGRLGAADQQASIVAAALLEFVHDRAALLGARVTAGRIIEGHGDLRPEHIFLGPPTAIIDCIEFNPEFRELDAADDLAFLSLECERLGAPAAGRLVFDEYGKRSGDRPDEALVAFYEARRALVRAKITLWHLLDGDAAREQEWIDRATHYVQLAEANARRAFP